jgi:hypothetical protein
MKKKKMTDSFENKRNNNQKMMELFRKGAIQIEITTNLTSNH